MLTLSYSSIKKYAFCALALPFLVFAIGWLEWYWAVLAVVATLVFGWGVSQNRRAMKIKK